MNKYLYKKIEQAHGSYFENLILIASEVCRPSISDTFEEFTELECKEICDVLDFNHEDETYELVKEEIQSNDFSSLLLKHSRSGFLAECRMPECSSFKFVEGRDRPSSWASHPGITTSFWIYADSIGELVEKLEKKSEELFLESVEDFKKSKK